MSDKIDLHNEYERQGEQFEDKRTRITSEQLDTLLESLMIYKRQGIIDPWLLSDGTTIEPLDILWELRAFRNLYPEGPKHWNTK